MENTDATLVLASRTGNPQTLQSNRLHVRILVGGNELELTNERADDKAESVNIQELISAFTGVLKETTNTKPIKPRLVVENAKDSDNNTEHQEVKTEIMRLKQLVQKFDGEIKHLRQLLQESKKENEELKIRFRSATHMKAAEVAQRHSRVSVVQSATNGRGSESVTDSEEPYTPEQRPTKFVMNPQVKEIDFLSLDDILGNDDAVEITSKETARDVAEGDDNTAMENPGSGSGTISSDDEKYFDSPTAEIFALPQATPPSVLKIGLDPDLARAGGKCKVEDSHGSPVRRSPQRRGRSNNHDSSAEREDAIKTDEDFMAPHDDSMVSTYGIMHKPSPNDGSCYKAVLIGNLPQDIDYHKLLAKVRGGYIISATLCDTSKLRGCGGRKSALVVFVNAQSARAYVQFANKHGICFDSQKGIVRLIETPTYPLSPPAERRITYGQTRYLVITKFNSELSLSRIDRVINTGMNNYRVDAIERFWKDEYGNVRIRFASINAAGMAYWRLKTDPNYNRLTMVFENDPCGRPLSDLLSTPIGRRSSDFINMKVNYDDEDDSNDENTREAKPVSPHGASKVNYVNEIELEDDEEGTVDDKPTEGKTASDQMANEGLKTGVEPEAINEATTMGDGTTANVLKSSTRAKTIHMATVASGKPAETENYREVEDSKTPNIFKGEVPPSTYNALKSKNVSNEDSTMLELDNLSPRILQLPGSAHEPSTITAMIPSAANGALVSWADDVNEAVEAGTLEAPAEFKAILPTITLMDISEEMVYPLANFLSTIDEEDPLMCEPIEGELFTEGLTDALTEALVAELPITELPPVHTSVVEDAVTAKSIKQLVTAQVIADQPLTTLSPVGVIEPPAVKLPSPVHAMIPNKFDLRGTDLDPAFLAGHAFQTVLSQKPRGGLTSSRWANPNTKAAKSIVVEAPLGASTLQDSEKATSELLFGKSPITEQTDATQLVSLPPPNASKGPRAGIPTSRWADPEISHKSPIQDRPVEMQKEPLMQTSEQSITKEIKPASSPKSFSTGPNFVPCESYNGVPTSRYAGLDPGASRPRSSLRDFYTAVDSQSAAPKNLVAAVPTAAVSQPATPTVAKPASETPSPDQCSYPHGSAGAGSALEGPGSVGGSQI